MEELFNTITAWQKDTFGETTPLSVAKHLRKEVDELIEALERGDKEHAEEELSDVQILLWNEAKKLGMDFYELSANVRKKHTKNLKRKWLKPDADGCVHHEKPELNIANYILGLGNKEELISSTWVYLGKTLEEMTKEELLILFKKQLNENPPNPHLVMFK